jgi:hypothetical protein
LPEIGFVVLEIGFVLVGKVRVLGVCEGVGGGGCMLIEVGLDTGETGELPIGDGHLFEQDFFEAAEGAVRGAEGVEKALESLFVFSREEGGAGAESVLEGIAGGDGFSG